MNLLDPQIPEPDNSATDPDWWRGAVIYQIYPRSYQDSNGDGVGDLAGIIHRLPHIASLGVDAVWISPFMKSPMLDFGYDVSDYRDVDPMFGTLGDFDALIERAHELGLKVLIDLVISHSSEDHPWFKESRASADNAKSDWYVWADAKPDGSPPNNWLSIFGGSAWEWDGERMQYYLHNFLTSQPDLNLHNMDVQDELLDITRFWLERGVDGFRLDTINFYFHDKQLRDNPALLPEERNDKTAPAVNPYNWQNHLYSKNQPENLEFLKRFRAVLDEFPGSTAVGEVGEAQRGMEIQAAYTSDGDKVHMTYGFDFLANQPLSGTHVAQVLNDYEDGIGDGWACWAFSNHDVVRHPSRWHMDEAGLRLAAALLLSLRGSVCLYQGEELGLPEAYVAFEDLQDPYGIRFWPKFKGRDGCRTPMVWNRDNHNGGFTEGKPWLPVAMEHVNRAVSVQDDDADSTLGFYRAMIAFRAKHPAFAKGTLTVHSATPETLVITRAHDGETLVCAFNFGGEETSVELPDGDWTRAADAPFDTTEQGQTVTLAPHGAYFGVLNG
ncbi:alpha-amylase family glycosyl hydrolase [Psychromarinibacter halotolerans]|uniref:Alpha-amylase family glycosyl hydrolase n=1 Tax=Psychromarinibacter halotolerans TaxID=1775175 RepID=A0ABV7GVY8_9RHOB|nr:alpha-amylase family glycosyl hydrolase [Psychromarinibacter halotolerans]MDF0594762.1 alpha-amylase family glycosyl hydrolase [Psychromarinibacter halotolerans]